MFGYIIMNMSVLVIDRDEEAVAELTELLSKIGAVPGSEIRVYRHSAEVLFDVEEGEIYPEVAFVEMSMGEESGVDLAARIREVYPRTQIIFLCLDSEQILNAYEVEHVWVLRKPVEESFLRKAWDRAMEHLHVPDERNFVFEFQRTRHIVPFSDILYFEKNRRKVLIHIRGLDDPMMFYSTMKDLQPVLTDSFFRCHESYIVNLLRIDSYSRSHFTVGENKIPISRRYTREAEERIHTIKNRSHTPER